MDRLKILVVDDEARMRKLVRDFLVRSQFEVIEAGDGAVTIVRRQNDARTEITVNVRRGFWIWNGERHEVG